MDLRDPSILGLSVDAICQDDFHANSLTLDLGAAALKRGAEALLVPSASREGDNLVVYTSQLRPGSRIVVAEHFDPNTYVPGR